ncbi:MAG: hypothetical protein HY645_13570 [Acidobacteria bacterium]|nr:hypothetical protein [Acidobacteriota bacterium]
MAVYEGQRYYEVAGADWRPKGWKARHVRNCATFSWVALCAFAVVCFERHIDFHFYGANYFLAGIPWVFMRFWVGLFLAVEAAFFLDKKIDHELREFLVPLAAVVSMLFLLFEMTRAFEGFACFLLFLAIYVLWPVATHVVFRYWAQQSRAFPKYPVMPVAAVVGVVAGLALGFALPARFLLDIIFLQTRSGQYVVRLIDSQGRLW